MQKHWDVMRSDNAGDLWHEVSGNLPTDFGFVVDVHAHEPETIYVVPSRATRSTFLWKASFACIAAARAEMSGSRSPKACRNAIVTSTCCAMRWRWTNSIPAASISEPRRPGVLSPDAGDNWAPIVHDLPAVLSVKCRHCNDSNRSPQHLRTLARVEGEVTVNVDGAVTQRSVLDRAGGPLSGTMRYHARPRDAKAATVH